MRMILIFGIMLATISALPSFLTPEDTEPSVPRSQALRAILKQTPNFQYLSKRSEESTNVLYRLDCCPSETHFIHLRGGISREGKLVELYRNHRTLQKFYETSCKAEVLEKPCPLIEQKVQHLSRCVQRYSYVYAFVKDYNVSESYRLDYIRIKSGCSCQLEFSYPTAVELDSQSQLEGEEP